MSKKKLFDDDSDEEINLETENEYAKKYDTWREKEEIHKLEQKYGPKALKSDGSESDSEDESDEPPEVSEEMEQQFLKTLSLLKTKDPRIYDPEYKFFDEEKKVVEDKKPKTKTLTFEDSDDDDEPGGDIFKIEKKAVIDDVEQEPAKAGGTTKTKGKKIKDFLTGKSKDVDEEEEKDLAPLKALWSDPKLNEGEAFLRDYILNKRYLEEGDAGELSAQVRDDADLEADEKTVEEQANFERAYNFRFEEPDDEYLKRFPRTMNSIRPKDDRRSRKRAEVRARKEEEKKRKMEEIARLKALKLKEVQEKIARIKEVTGNQDLAFEEEDIEGDFDPEAHDRRMAALFGGEYYGDAADDRKPVFPDLDDELEIENWDNYEVGDENVTEQGDGPHCEDDDFNMDADYNPSKPRANLLEEIQKTLGKKRRNRKRKSKLAELLSSQKPKYVPDAHAQTYAQFMEEYYKMDCEDVIGGDLTTRFKYREVVPNDYGLTVEEILLADDKELTQWVPLKRIVRIRPDAAEKSDRAAYKQRAADDRLKRKLLPSLFRDLPQEPEIVVPVEEETKKKKKKKKENKEKTEDAETLENGVDVNNDDTEMNNTEATNADDKTTTEEAPTELPKKKKKKHKKNKNLEDNEATQNNAETTDETTMEIPKKKKQKRNLEGSNIEEHNEITKLDPVNNDAISKEKRKKKKHKSNGFVVTNVDNEEPSLENNSAENSPEKTAQVGSKRKLSETGNEELPQKKKIKTNKKTLPEVAHNVKKKDKKRNKKNMSNNKEHKKKNIFKNKQKDDKSAENPLNKLSDERLKAYGLNPKKYRGFLKYKKY